MADSPLEVPHDMTGSHLWQDVVPAAGLQG